MTQLYHDAQRRLQDRFDTRRLADRIEERLVHDFIDQHDAEFISARDMFSAAGSGLETFGLGLRRASGKRPRTRTATAE